MTSPRDTEPVDYWFLLGLGVVITIVVASFFV